MAGGRVVELGIHAEARRSLRGDEGNGGGAERLLLTIGGVGNREGVGIHGEDICYGRPDP